MYVLPAGRVGGPDRAIETRKGRAHFDPVIGSVAVVGAGRGGEGATRGRPHEHQARAAQDQGHARHGREGEGVVGQGGPGREGMGHGLDE